MNMNDDLTEARIRAILGRPATGYALEVLRREAGAPPLRRQAKDNPYRLAPLMADELDRDRQWPPWAPMATPLEARDDDDAKPNYKRFAAATLLVAMVVFMIVVVLSLAPNWVGMPS